MTRRQKNFVDQYILNGGCASAAARALFVETLERVWADIEKTESETDSN